ncbi:Leucine-rich repeat [Macleaya cordata]|uniref:Leucine-rich repeat n=1 Tax=Macleaya cordata TaxID=56857 RepID=A0A200PVM0_MACCD|nr:Leucine-rich repeat [Macleaya cordata]
MADVPDLMSLCMEAIITEIIHGDRQVIQNVFELPEDLFDCLVMRLPPLGLHKLQQQMSFKHFGESTIDGFKDGKKRGRYCALNTAWKSIYKSRWPEGVRQTQPMDHLTKQSIPRFEPARFSGDWQQMYWEAHLQDCLDKAAEAAHLPSFDGCIGEITIPGTIMESIGYKRCLCHTTCAYSKLSYHCQQFGCYARCLRLQNVLCVAETCRLLRDSKLRCLILRGIKSEEHVNGTCKFLKQNSETLSSLEFIYCKLSSTAINAISNSLYVNGIQTHGIQYFSIKASSILESNPVSLPPGLLTFLSSGSSLCMLSFCENHLGPSFAKMVFNTLIDASSGLSVLDLSDNNIAGWLSSANGRLSSCLPSSLGTSKSLSSLRVLNLRANNLRKDDANGLRYALLQMPNLESLDLSENPIDDDGVRNLIPYFAEASERDSPLSDVKIENCNLSYDGVADLLRNLSTLKKPLNSLSIADNDLGRQVAEPLAKFLGASCIRVLSIEDIGLGPSGFFKLREEIPKEMKLAYINISKNRGGIEAAKFIVELILRAPELVAINAGYNFMPLESLEAICSALSLSKGRLEQLDLTGNTRCYQPAHTSMLTEFQFRGRPIMILPSCPVTEAPYDDDP